MYSRVTLLEIDTLRIDVEAAVALFEDEVLPALRDQDEYEGCYVLTTPEGRAQLLTFWATPEAAEAGARAGFYAETLGRYLTLFSAPPGRERYEVAFADAPAGVS